MAKDRIPADEVFNAARRLTDSDARRGYLDQACGEDGTLRARVDALLRAHDEGGDFLQSPVAGGGIGRALESIALPAPEGPGSMVGPYKVLQRIGEGGFGVVYMAEQQHPVRRKVALKLIKPGFDTRQVIARFEAERQALALMDHENIAKVLDAGATDSGRPYFVMELVHGVPITEFCDAIQLAPHRRLELFVQVCRAVQHAHGKGVIHRDIKPTNVLVTLHEGVPVPKVIDFGIAKATGQPLTDKTLFTNFAQMVGTPLYMSPEQAEMTGVDVDTRSDVYSLGVLLYELLTGTTPVDRNRLDRAAFDEVRRIIREENPPRPSTRLSTMDEQARSLLAARRRSDPRRLGQLVRGELDWIVMKALEKDRERRYETAHGLGLDVQRYLDNEPVRACPPSAIYRARTFVRRHRGAVLAAAIVLVTLAGGIVGTTMGLLRAERARQGESDRAEGERRAKERAEANLALARESVETYLGTVTNDPDLLQSDFHRLRKRLLEGALPFFERIAAQASDDPGIEASRGRAHHRLALVHLTLGDFAAAQADAESMVAIFTRLTTTSPTVPAYRHGLANGLHNLAVALTRLGKFEDAEPVYSHALRIYEALVAERPREPEYAYEHAVCQNALGVLLHDLGRHGDAEAAYARALDLHTQVAAAFPGHAENRGRLAGSLHNLGALRTSVGRYAEAEAAFRTALPVQESLAREFPGNPTYRRTLAQHHHSLGEVLLHQGDLRDAEAAFHRAVTLNQQLAADFGTVPDYRHAIGQGYCNLGVARVRMGKYPEAEEALHQALIIQAKLAAEFRRVPEYQAVQAAILNNLGNVLLEQGKLREGEDVLHDSLKIQEALVADHPGVPEYALDLGGNYCNLGQLLRDSGQPDASIPWFEKAIARLQAEAAREPRLVTAQEFLRNSHRGKADALDALGRHAEAIESHEKALAFARQLNGPGHPGTIAQAYDLIDRYDALGRHADALRLREELLTVRQTTLGPDDPETLGAMANLANGYANLGRDADALQLRERTLTLMRARIPDHPYLLITLEACAVALLRLGRGAEAVPLLDECVRRAEGQPAQEEFVHRVLGFRLRHFEGQRDPSGCRETAEMWERQGRTDADSLYDAACYRGVTAAVVRAADRGEEAARARAAEAEADRAMGWLRKALAVGFSDLAHLEKDEDLAALRDRADFQELVTLWRQRVR